MELLAKWLPLQGWFDGGDAPVVPLGSFRFDDPAGQVGVETHVVAAAGRVYQVPLTYRGAPLEGAAEFLVGTMEHSVLGGRWVYDATADPVYQAELAAALLAAKPQAVAHRMTDGRAEALPHTAVLASTGRPGAVLPGLHFGVPATSTDITRIPAGALTVEVLRVLGAADALHAPSLTLTWEGQDVPVLIASLVS